MYNNSIMDILKTDIAKAVFSAMGRKGGSRTNPRKGFGSSGQARRAALLSVQRRREKSLFK